MLTLTLNIDGAEEIKADLGVLVSRLENSADLHEGIGEVVKDFVSEHISTTKSSPNTGWWGRAAASVKHSFDAVETVVSIPYPGVALRYYGGTVTKKPDGPHLSIPTDDVPVVDGTRLAAREAGDLAFIPNNKGGATIGYLVEGESYTKTRGPNKGKEGPRPKEGGNLLYVLRTETDHQPDPSVLPTRAELLKTARGAALDYLELFT